MTNNLSFHFRNCLLNPNHSKSDYRHDNLWNNDTTLSMCRIKFYSKHTSFFLMIHKSCRNRIEQYLNNFF